MTCVTSASTTTINLVGGSGLATGAVGGGAGGGGGGSITSWAGSTLGAMSNFGTSPGAVPVPGNNAYIINTPPVSQSGNWTVRNVGNAGGILDGATGSAVPANAFYLGVNVGGNLSGLTGTANGLKVDGSAVTQPISGSVSLSGTLPAFAASPTVNLGTLGGAATAANQTAGSNYGNQANFVSGTGNVATTTPTQIIAAPGSNKLYITNAQCFRTDAGTTMAYVTFNDGAATVEALPAGGGTNVTFTTPLVVAATTAFKFTPSAGLATVYCSAQGYNAS